MNYQQWIAYSREELLEKVSSVMSPERFQHVLSVEETAIELAKRFGVGEAKAGLAGLLHDYAKEVNDEEFHQLIEKYGLNKELKKWNNNVWHGLVGIYKIQEDLGVTDPEILQAIAVHTVGSKKMSPLDKILYVADYIEPNRDFPGVEKAREIAQVSLNRAVAYGTAKTLEHLSQQGLAIYPQTLETYNTFVKYLKEERAKTAFIIIDVQNALVDARPYDIDAVLGRITHALEVVRSNQIPVIYIRHTNGEFVEGSEAWQIHEQVAPREEDKIFNKTYNSVFKGTDLHAYLQENGIEKVIFAGMLANYCVDTSVKVAFEFDYKVGVLEYGTTTFDGEDLSAQAAREYHENIWADCFAEVDEIEELLG